MSTTTPSRPAAADSFMPHGSTPSTSSFTCNTCGIKFPTAELQRKHMKTEWHRYNLKRKVAELPAISSSTFAELVLARQDIDETVDEDEYGFAINHKKTKSGVRQLTKKDLKRQSKENRGRQYTIDGVERNIHPSSGERSVSPSAASIHSEFSEFSIGEGDHHSIERNSTNYSEYASETDKSHTEYTSEESDFDHIEDDEDENDDDDAESLDTESYDELKEEIATTTCFYCGLKHSEREENIRHMFNKHGLYIPERSYLTDPDGLLLFIGEIIVEDHECMVCGFLGKNLESIRQHIKSKGHCRIPYETKEEKATIGEFYNFNVDVKSKNNKNNKSKGVAFDEEFEVINEDEQLENSSEKEDDEEVETSEHDSSNYSVVEVDPSGVELTLPTGSRIGHRSMTRYYRQNLALPRDLNESERTVAVADRRFAPGLTVKEVTKQEKLTRRIEQKAKNQFYRKDKGSQINYQPHFRDELLGPM